MVCCEKCFDDEFLIAKIRENNKTGKCNYCEEDDVYIVECKILNPYFLRLLNLYIPTQSYENYDPEYEHPDEVGTVLIQLINEDWSIFSKSIQDYIIDYELLFDILNANENGKHFDSNEVYSNLTDGKSYEDPFFMWKLFWDELKNELKHGNRFFPYFDINDKILEVLKYRTHKLQPGTELYRARIGEHGKEEMLAPPSKIAQAGRANPKGISYLYCADDKETCIAEVRPWKGATITVASVKVNRDLLLVDLSDKKFSPLIFEDYTDILALDTLITRFAKELSTPVNPSNSEIDYLPTQYLTELLKVKGYDGIYFKSAMGPNHNIVIFDEINVTIENVEVVQITDIKYVTTEDNSASLLDSFSFFD